MSPAVKPRPAAALEVTFLAAQCHKGTCLQPQAYLGHTQTSLVEGAGLAMAESFPHFTRSHKTPFRAAKTPLVCTVAPIIYLLWPARNEGKLSSPLSPWSAPKQSALRASLCVVPWDGAGATDTEQKGHLRE